MRDFSTPFFEQDVANGDQGTVGSNTQYAQTAEINETRFPSVDDVLAGLDHLFACETALS